MMKEIVNLVKKELNTNLDKQEKINKKLSTFRQGKLVIKKRNENAYYYLEYRVGRKVKTDYLGKVNSGEIEKYLNEREEYKELITKLDELKTEETKYRKILDEFGVINYRKIYTIHEIKKILKPVFKKYGIEKAYLFGSYARGEANSNSDIDLILRRPKKGDWFDFEEEAKEKLGKEIDFIYSGDVVQSQFLDNIQKEWILIC